jgi:hypothetical protein
MPFGNDKLRASAKTLSVDAAKGMQAASPSLRLPFAAGSSVQSAGVVWVRLVSYSPLRSDAAGTINEGIVSLQKRVKQKRRAARI